MLRAAGGLMAIVLQYSADRGSSWTTLDGYTHPTSAGVTSVRVPIGGLRLGDGTVRFRLTGTDAANWGLYDWRIEAPVTVKQERDLG